MIRQSAELYRAQQAEMKRPIYDQLAVTEQLLKNQCQELEKALDLYLTGGILQEMLLDKKERLEARIRALEAERIELIRQLEATTLTDEQIHSLEAFAIAVGEGLDEADEDFALRRRIIEMLGIKGQLLDFGRERKIKVTCHFKQSDTLIVSTTIAGNAQPSQTSPPPPGNGRNTRSGYAPQTPPRPPPKTSTTPRQS